VGRCGRDYFKPPHFEEVTELHRSSNEATKYQVPRCKGLADPDVADSVWQDRRRSQPDRLGDLSRVTTVYEFQPVRQRTRGRLWYPMVHELAEYETRRPPTMPPEPPTI